MSKLRIKNFKVSACEIISYLNRIFRNMLLLIFLPNPDKSVLFSIDILLLLFLQRFLIDLLGGHGHFLASYSVRRCPITVFVPWKTIERMCRRLLPVCCSRWRYILAVKSLYRSTDRFVDCTFMGADFNLFERLILICISLF